MGCGGEESTPIVRVGECGEEGDEAAMDVCEGEEGRVSAHFGDFRDVDEEGASGGAVVGAAGEPEQVGVEVVADEAAGVVAGFRGDAEGADGGDEMVRVDAGAVGAAGAGDGRHVAADIAGVVRDAVDAPVYGLGFRGDRGAGGDAGGDDPAGFAAADGGDGELPCVVRGDGEDEGMDADLAVEDGAVEGGGDFAGGVSGVAAEGFEAGEEEGFHGGAGR